MLVKIAQAESCNAWLGRKLLLSRMPLLIICLCAIIESALVLLSGKEALAFGPGLDPYDDYQPINLLRSFSPSGQIKAGTKFHVSLCMAASEAIPEAVMKIYVPEEVEVIGHLAVSPTDDKEWYLRPMREAATRDLAWKGVIEPPKRTFIDKILGKRLEREQCLNAELLSRTDWAEWSRPVKVRAAFSYNNNGEYWSWPSGYYYHDTLWSHEGRTETGWVGATDFSCSSCKVPDPERKWVFKEIRLLKTVTDRFCSKAYIGTADDEVLCIRVGDRLGEKAQVSEIRDSAIFVKKKTRKGEIEIIYELNEKPKVFRVVEAPRPKSDIPVVAIGPYLIQDKQESTIDPDED